MPARASGGARPRAPVRRRLRLGESRAGSRRRGAVARSGRALSGMRGLSVFISDIRNCHNKEQERLLVDKELGNIRNRFKNEKIGKVGGEKWKSRVMLGGSKLAEANLTGKKGSLERRMGAMRAVQ
ncbi:uncharacterized protein LOC119318234 [Triticum dicoccoides]|uniref:uncharacterized protein LOC119318234 n=1 Tax=Triticum dicoccoides TaxID=85692 RepID=UPI00188F763F|nr:uncharacterized protein LOC119318234 [Triticum dicoccoides]